MRKAEYHVTIICPFDYCHKDVDNSRMTPSCIDCSYCELKKEMVSDTIELDRDSEEVKEFENKYSHCYQSNE